MFAFVAAATGWTWEYIGQCLTLPRLAAMQRVWRMYPPVNVTAAVFAGFKPAPDMAEQKLTHEDIAKAMTADPRKLKWISVPNERRHG